MKVKYLKTTLFLAMIIMTLNAIEIPLHEQPRCMIVTATYQPIKVQIQFPPIPNKLEGQRYRITLVQFTTDNIISQQFVQGQLLYRKNYKLQPDVLYHLCMEIVKVRNYFKPDQEVYVNYVATEDFETLIGKIQIPPELAGEQNLQQIYKISKQLTNLNKNILENQKKQRELQDKLVTQNVHKNQRIYTLTLIQCLVIILSGVYQVFALRKFLIQKNLY